MRLLTREMVIRLAWEARPSWYRPRHWQSWRLKRLTILGPPPLLSNWRRSRVSAGMDRSVKRSRTSGSGLALPLKSNRLIVASGAVRRLLNSVVAHQTIELIGFAFADELGSVAQHRPFGAVKADRHAIGQREGGAGQ